jgi:hypothetical protein
MYSTSFGVCIVRAYLPIFNFQKMCAHSDVEMLWGFANKMGVFSNFIWCVVQHMKIEEVSR